MWRSVLLAGGLGLVGCGGDDGGSPAAAAVTVAYRFQDSSVPPEYHRSYSLELTGADDGAHGELVVDSYGDVLHRVDVDVDGATWQAAVGDLAALDVAGSTAAGCAGGTGRELTVRDGDETLTAIEIDVCGGDGEEAADALDAAVDPLLDGVDMAALLATD